MVISDLTNKELLEQLDNNIRFIVFHKTQLTYHKTMIKEQDRKANKIRKELSKRL